MSLHLILHKVRGESAFDIAECIGDDSDGPLWIIPTSGHRAYPARTWDLDDMADISDINNAGFHEKPIHSLDLVLDVQDHYSCNDRPLREAAYTVKKRVAGLLESLGLVKPVIVERRF